MANTNKNTKHSQRLERVAGHLILQPASGSSSFKNVIQYSVQNGVAVLLMKSPPVNSLGPDMTASIKAAVERANADDSVKAIVFTGAGKFFMAGADIPNLMKIANSGAQQDIEHFMRSGHDLFNGIESGGKPTVAAVNGPALGGGLELAMACNARIGSKASIYGLPELKLGLIPGLGGTQRLPRLIGVAAATKAMLSSKPFPAKKALKLGLIDHLVKKSKDLLPTAIKAALAIASGAQPRRVSLEVKERIGSRAKGVEAIELARIKSRRRAKGTPHASACLDAVKAGLLQGGEKGIEAEMKAFEVCISSPSARGLIHTFLSSKLAAKVPGLQGIRPAGKVQTVAVLGGGTMGAGIVALMLFKGYHVILKEINQDLLFQGVKRVAATISSVLKRMKMPQIAMEMGMRNLTPTTSYEGFERCDMVVEAIIENIPIKQKVFQDLERVCRKDCIFATNTSTIDIDVIGEKTNAQDRIVGLHFFAPAHVMPLLEIIRTNSTSKQTLAASIAYAKRLGKTPVTVGNCVGFTANRIFYPYGQAAAFLVDRGVSPYRIDKLLKKIVHMPMGCHEMADLSGLDIMGHVTKQFVDAYRERTYVSKLGPLMLEAKRMGRKNGIGFYKYKGRATIPDPKGIAALLAKARQGIEPFKAITDQQIIETVMYPIVNESCRILAEKMVIRASDIDVVSITGYGFPAHKGGIMHWAQSQGLKNVVGKLSALAAANPQQAAFFAPCEYLKNLASKSA